VSFFLQIERRKINEVGQVTNLKNMYEHSKIGVLKSGNKYLSNKNSIGASMDYPLSELLVDSFYGIDFNRPFTIHLNNWIMILPTAFYQI
jgi:hypothetical protein